MGGPCFLEAIVAVLTGNLVQTRPGQLDEIDAALGRELQAGSSTLREVVSRNSKSPASLIRRIVSTLEKKSFRDNIERQESCRLFADILTRHPHLSTMTTTTTTTTEK